MFDETSTTAAIVDAIDGAKQVVNAEFFGISDAGKGAQLTQALARAARRGVEVNVIADFVSQIVPPFGAFHRFRDEIEGAGGHVIVTDHNPLSKEYRATPGLRHVDHRKVVTVDGSRAFVGGMNFVQLTDGYHDTMVRLAGVDAARVAVNESERWKAVGGTVTGRQQQTIAAGLGGAPVVPTERTAIRMIDNAPDLGRFDLTNSYLELIRGAKHRLWIASPGISDRSIMQEIAAAAARGVDVRIVTPGTAPLGVPVLNWVARGHFQALAKHGGTGYQIPEVLHRKALIADDEAILSSYNLTDRSREHDHESGVRTADPEFVAAVTDIFQRDIDRAAKYDPSTATRLADRIGAFLAKHVTY